MILFWEPSHQVSPLFVNLSGWWSHNWCPLLVPFSPTLPQKSAVWFHPFTKTLSTAQAKRISKSWSFCPRKRAKQPQLMWCWLWQCQDLQTLLWKQPSVRLNQNHNNSTSVPTYNGSFACTRHTTHLHIHKYTTTWWGIPYRYTTHPHAYTYKHTHTHLTVDSFLARHTHMPTHTHSHTTTWRGTYRLYS